MKIGKSLSSLSKRGQSDKSGASVFTRGRKWLLGQRRDLRMLIYTMENDKNLGTAPWQILSMKDQLRNVERRISLSRYPKYRDKYEHR